MFPESRVAYMSYVGQLVEVRESKQVTFIGLFCWSFLQVSFNVVGLFCGSPFHHLCLFFQSPGRHCVPCIVRGLSFVGQVTIIGLIC